MLNTKVIVSYKHKLATVTSYKADVSSVSPSYYIFNLVDITKLPCYPHRRSTTVSLETFTLYSYKHRYAKRAKVNVLSEGGGR